MGVTVSTAKLAAAYQANNGQTVYVLFEQTFDKNDYAQRISAFTEHVKAAAAIPPGTHAVVDRTVPLSEDWQILSRDQVLRSLGLDVLSSSRCFKIPVTFNHEHINTLMRLSKKCLTWHLGQPPQQQLEMVA